MFTKNALPLFMMFTIAFSLYSNTDQNKECVESINIIQSQVKHNQELDKSSNEENRKWEYLTIALALSTIISSGADTYYKSAEKASILTQCLGGFTVGSALFTMSSFMGTAMAQSSRHMENSALTNKLIKPQQKPTSPIK